MENTTTLGGFTMATTIYTSDIVDAKLSSIETKIEKASNVSGISTKSNSELQTIGTYSLNSWNGAYGFFQTVDSFFKTDETTLGLTEFTIYTTTSGNRDNKYAGPMYAIVNGQKTVSVDVTYGSSNTAYAMTFENGMLDVQHDTVLTCSFFNAETSARVELQLATTDSITAVSDYENNRVCNKLSDDTPYSTITHNCICIKAMKAYQNKYNCPSVSTWAKKGYGKTTEFVFDVSKVMKNKDTKIFKFSETDDTVLKVTHNIIKSLSFQISGSDGWANHNRAWKGNTALVINGVQSDTFSTANLTSTGYTQTVTFSSPVYIPADGIVRGKFVKVTDDSMNGKHAILVLNDTFEIDDVNVYKYNELDDTTDIAKIDDTQKDKDVTDGLPSKACPVYGMTTSASTNIYM